MTVCLADEEGLSEAHEFYKNIPAGIFGSKKPKSAEAVCNKVVNSKCVLLITI